MVASPWTVAATVREVELMSTTSRTGVRVSVATWALEAKPSAPRRPSMRPMTPSSTATSAGVGWVAPRASSGWTRSSPTSHGSRVRLGRPVASAW